MLCRHSMLKFQSILTTFALTLACQAPLSRGGVQYIHPTEDGGFSISRAGEETVHLKPDEAGNFKLVKSDQNSSYVQPGKDGDFIITTPGDIVIEIRPGVGGKVHISAPGQPICYVRSRADGSTINTLKPPMVYIRIGNDGSYTVITPAKKN